MWESKHICADFLANSSMDLDKIWSAAMTCCSVEAHADFFLFLFISHDKIQGKELYLCELKKNVFKICIHSDTYKPISFKLGMMLDMSNYAF